MKVDNFLRELIFRKFRIAGVTFDFLEALLAVCITGGGRGRWAAGEEGWV